MIDFEKFYNEKSAPLYSLALRLNNNNVSDANDLVQESLYRAQKNLHKVKDENSLFDWVYSIVRRTHIDLWRKNTAKGRMMISNFSIEELEKYRPFVNPVDNFRYEKLHSCIKNLSPFQKKVIEYFYFQGFSLDEISKKLHITVGAVKTNLFRAKKKLGEILKKK